LTLIRNDYAYSYQHGNIIRDTKITRELKNYVGNTNKIEKKFWKKTKKNNNKNKSSKKSDCRDLAGAVFFVEFLLFFRFFQIFWPFCSCCQHNFSILA